MKIVGCFLEYNDKFVMLRRHPHKPRGGTWDLPAGKVEQGEKDIEAVLRELHEETGFSSSIEPEHLGTFIFGKGEGEYSFATYRIKINKPFDVILEDEAHSEFRWVTADECYRLDGLIPDFQDLLKRIDYVNWSYS